MAKRSKTSKVTIRMRHRSPAEAIRDTIRRALGDKTPPTGTLRFRTFKNIGGRPAQFAEWLPESSSLGSIGVVGRGPSPVSIAIGKKYPQMRGKHYTAMHRTNVRSLPRAWRKGVMAHELFHTKPIIGKSELLAHMVGGYRGLSGGGVKGAVRQIGHYKRSRPELYRTLLKRTGGAGAAVSLALLTAYLLRRKKKKVKDTEDVEDAGKKMS